MSVENNNEFENLFQRASEHYPLNTDSANWNAVLEKLEKEGNQKGLLLKKRLLFLLILLAVGLISVFLTNQFVNWNAKNKTVIVPTLKEKQESENNLLKKITEAVYNKVVDSLKGDVRFKIVNEVSTSNIHLKKETAPSKTILEDLNSNKKFNLNKIYPPVINTEAFTNQLEKATSAINPSTVSVTSNENKQQSFENSADTVVVAAKSIKNLSDTNINQQKTVVGTVVKKNKTAFEKYFYTGFLYAADKSSINFEPSKGIGYSWALALGYQFSKRFSLESGIHIEKKEYYTTGEHFDKSILPATGKILWIESENKLLEIPITLKTNFSPGKKHQFFGSVGISSYLINNESYEYEEELNGVIQNEFIQFTKNSSSLFATTNLSFGYEYKFISGIRLRIEPYLNLPLSGIGKGKEPILSKGVYVGLIYDFHKKKLKQ